MSQPETVPEKKQGEGKEKTHDFDEDLCLVTLLQYFYSVHFSDYMLNETYVLHLVMHDPNLLIKELYGSPSECPTFQNKLEIMLQSSS